ncbi:MAG TPA: hypothetical protein VES59_10960 [Bacteroidota bacterium]|nr:hypothetical protein [Bacteroidota bacterium]
MKLRCLRFVLVLLPILRCPSVGQVPRLLAYQGVLTDSLGNAKPDGPHSFTFRFYLSLNGGNALWSETQTLQVRRGLFSASLGSVAPIPDSLQFDQQYYFTLQIDGGPELSPRVPLSAVGYSLNSLRADSAKFVKNLPPVPRPLSPPIAAGEISDSSVINSKLADSSVTSRKIARGQVVRSLNGLKDTVLLLAGNNVTITPGGNSLTISSTTGGGGGLTLPFRGAIASDSDAFSVTNNGLGRAGVFEMTALNASAAALLARSAGPNNAIDGVALGSGYAVSGSTASANAWPGYFSITNNKSASSALFAVTDGKGEAVYGRNLGLGTAGRFEVSNAADTSSALYGGTNGAGSALYSQNSGTGTAAQFYVLNGASNAYAVQAQTVGQGDAGNFLVNSATSSGNGVYGIANGTGAGVRGFNAGKGSAGWFENYAGGGLIPSPTVMVLSNGEPGHGILCKKTGDEGSAGFFWNSKSSNPSPALLAVTSGNGVAVRGVGGAIGGGARFDIDTATNGQTALEAYTSGTGPAAVCRINAAAANINPALVAETNSIGVAAEILSTSTTNNNNPGMRVTYSGTLNAAEFTADNSSGAGDAILATSHGTGSAVYAVGGKGPGLTATNGFIAPRAAQFLAQGSGGGDAVYAQSESGNAITAESFGIGYLFHGTQYGNSNGVVIDMNSSISSFNALAISQSSSGTGINVSGGNSIITRAVGKPNRVGIRSFVDDSTDWAGDFNGNVNINGTLTSTVKDFKIDHPLDPANKYLSHSVVESSEMINVYSGNATLDAQGGAIVHLAGWFEAANYDFRYQLTCVGGYAPVYIAQEISANQFRIAGGRAGLKVSWQVSGVRQDPYAKAHPLRVEEYKPPDERGFYRHPEVYGLPEDRGINWAHDRDLMQKMRAKREEHHSDNK